MKKFLVAMSIAAFSALSARAVVQQARDAGADASEIAQAEADASVRLEARLQPVIAVDASGQARLDIEVGTAIHRFTAEVEIAKADFADLRSPGEMVSGMKSWICASCVAVCGFIAIVSSSPEIL